MVDVSAYGNNLEFVCVCFNFPMFFKSFDVFDGPMCGTGAALCIESVGNNLVMSLAYAILFVWALGDGGDMALA